MRKVLFITTAFYFLFLLQAASQSRLGVGVEGIYNFQTNSYAPGVRLYYQINDAVALVPQVSYFPGFNPIHETYMGASLHYSFVFYRGWEGYAAFSGLYNNWMNAHEFDDSRDSQNLALEVGGGIMKSYGCVKPFAESRYDAKWKEANVRIGIYFFFGNCGGGGGGSFNTCPAFN